MSKQKPDAAQPSAPAPPAPLVQTVLDQSAAARPKPPVPPSGAPLVDRVIEIADPGPRRPAPARPPPLMDTLARQAPPATAGVRPPGPVLATLVAGATRPPTVAPGPAPGAATLLQSSERIAPHMVARPAQADRRIVAPSLADTVISQQAAAPRPTAVPDPGGPALVERLVTQPPAPRPPPAALAGAVLVQSAEAPDATPRRGGRKRSGWAAPLLVLAAILVAVLTTAAWIGFGHPPR